MSPRSHSAHRHVVMALLAMLLPAACGNTRSAAQGGDLCLAETTLSERFEFASAARGATILGEADDWARQLSAFERSARLRTLNPTDLEDFLEFASGAAVDWTPAHKDYWQTLIDRLSVAVAGLNLDMPQGFIVKTTGEEEFNMAYVRNRSIVLPREFIELARDERRDFLLLAHELFHLLSAENPAKRHELYALLGFERVANFTYPPELEERRLSNPDAHWYEHALGVQTESGSADVIPVIQATVPLEEVVQLPTQGPLGLFSVIEIVLLPVDVGSGTVLRDENGELMRYGFDNTDWPARMQRNSPLIIDPEELMADNFALLMEWRSTAAVPTELPGPPGQEGFPVTDIDLLTAIEDVVTTGCGG